MYKETPKYLFLAVTLLASLAFAQEPAAPAAAAPVFAPQIKTGGLLQVWYTDDSTPSASAVRNNFKIRRAEMKFSGDAAETTTWTVTTDFAKTLATSATTVVTGVGPTTTTSVNSVNTAGDLKVIQDAYITNKLSANWSVVAGQLKMWGPSESFESSSKLLFAERSIVARTFGERRETGAQLNFTAEGIKASIMASNGTGTNLNDTDTSKDSSFRVDYAVNKNYSLGGFGVAKESFYTDLSKWGVNFAYNDDVYLFKAEFANGYTSGVRSQTTVYDLAYQFASPVQLALRYETYRADMTKDPKSAASTLGLNYFINKHSSKIQLDYTALDDFKGSTGSSSAQTNSDGSLVTVSFQTNY